MADELTYKERWGKAIERAKRLLTIYQELPGGAGAFGAMMIQRDIDLYEAGDHSEVLLESIEGIKE